MMMFEKDFLFNLTGNRELVSKHPQSVIPFRTFAFERVFSYRQRDFHNFLALC